MPSLEVSALFGGHPLSSEGTGYAPKRHCGAKSFTACFLAKQAVSVFAMSPEQFDGKLLDGKLGVSVHFLAKQS